jgi:hypothetical protein
VGGKGGGGGRGGEMIQALYAHMNNKRKKKMKFIETKYSLILGFRNSLFLKQILSYILR